MNKRVAVAFTVLLVGCVFWAQTRSAPKTAAEPKLALACGPNHADMMDELGEMNVYVSRMQSRIVMIRNSAGVIENPQLRNALQVNADMWQDEVDHLKQQMNRMHLIADRCEAQEKIRQGETQR